MAEITLEDFENAKNPVLEAVSNAAMAAPPSSAAAEFAQRRNAQDISRLAPGAPTLRQDLGEEGRVPLDIDTGLGAGVEFELARHPTETDKMRYLASQYGADKIKLNARGEPIVRVKNADGTERDVLVNARGLSFSDLGAVAAHVPELIGAALGPRAFGAVTGANPQTMSALAKTFASVLGFEAAGAVQDAAVRAMEGAPVEPGEIASRREKSALANTALTGVGLLGAKGTQLLGNAIEDVAMGANPLRRVPSPVRLMRGPIQEAATESVERIADQSGHRLSLSAGQSTGNPFVATAEVYLENAQAGAGPQQAAELARQAERRNFMDWMYDPATLPLDEDIGRRGIAILNNVAETSNTAVRGAKDQIQRESQQYINDLLNLRFNNRQAPQPMVVGTTARNAADELRNIYRTERNARWNALYQHPRANTIRPELTEVSTASRELIRNWPKDPKTGEPLTEFGMSGLFNSINRAAEVSAPQQIQRGMLGHTQPETMPLNELHGLRVLLDQQIAGGQAIAGIKDQKLITLRNAISDSIERGVARDPELAQLWRAANDYTHENAPRFENKNIAQLFRDPDQANYIGDSEFIASLSGNEDKYNAVRRFFGSRSDEMLLIDRNIVNGMLANARVTGPGGTGDIIDPKALLNSMNALSHGKTTGSIYQSIFGRNGEAIRRELRTLDQANQLEGESISANEFLRALDPSERTRPSVERLLESQRENRAIYSNNIIKRFVKGEVGVANIKGEDLVNKWFDGADLTDVRDVVTRLNAADPNVAEDFARKAIQKFFVDASKQETPSDALAMLRGAPSGLPSGTAMVKTLGSRDKQEKLQAVIGEGNMDLLRDFAAVELSEDEKRRLADGTGIMVRGGIISALIHGKGTVMKELSEWAKVKAISYMMTRPTLNTILASQYRSADLPDLARVIVSSEPFLAALADDMKGDSRAFEMLSQLKHGAFGNLMDVRQPQRSPAPTMTEGEFKSQLRNPLQ